MAATQIGRATGGDGSGGRAVAGDRAPAPTEGDPPTLPLPPVPAGPHRAASRPQARRPGAPAGRHHRSAGVGLRRAVWTATMILVLSVGALVATELHTWRVFNASSPTPSDAGRQPTTTPAAATLRPVSIGSSSAEYAVSVTSFSVTVSTNRPTWVEARAGSAGRTLFAGVIPAGEQRQLDAQGPLWIKVGAGGSTLVVRSSGRLLGTLHPQVAPWQVTFSPST